MHDEEVLEEGHDFGGVSEEEIPESGDDFKFDEFEDEDPDKDH